MNHFQRIREQLKSLDAILLTSEANRFYACGFHTTGEDDARVLITGDGAYFFTDSRYTEAATNSIEGAKILDNKEIVNHLKGKIGFEDASVTVKRFNRWTKDFNCEFVPVSDLMGELRQSKDEQEIENLVAAQRIAEKALAELISEPLEGRTEKEIAVMLQNLLYKHGADGLSFDSIVASGPNSSMPHAVPGNRTVQRGDFLTIDYGCLFNGYCSDTTRTFAVGYASDEMKNVYNVVLEAQKAGIAKAKAGVPGKDVHNAAADVIAKAGYGDYFGHGFGHSLGIEIHESPNFNPKGETPMPLNAVVSAEPGIYLPGKFGVRIEDVVILKEDGCIDITEFGKELTVIA